MAAPPTPVTLGLPIYNGERFVREALDSALAQTHPDVRIIISDNGSTDGTEAICRAYASEHRSIEYHRSDVNLGASWNFRRVFELADTPYFKWIAHDDVIAPEFISSCAAALDADSNAVLAFTLASMIDEQGTVLELPSYSIRTDSSRPSDRFADLVLSGGQCFEIFGVIRSDGLARTPVMGAYSHADGVVLAGLGLLGRFRLVDERLFFSRQHSDQSIRVHHGGHDVGRPDYLSYAEWFDPAKRSRLQLPELADPRRVRPGDLEE